MGLTKDEHRDLSIRLEVLMGEHAPASDRATAVRRVHEILARVPIVDAPVEEPVKIDAPAEVDAPVEDEQTTHD